MNDKPSKFPTEADDMPELKLQVSHQNDPSTSAMIKEIYAVLPLIRQMHRKLLSIAQAPETVSCTRTDNPLYYFPSAEVAEKVIIDYIAAAKTMGLTQFTTQALAIAIRAAGNIPENAGIRISLMLDDELLSRVGLWKKSKFTFVIADKNPKPTENYNDR